MKTEIITSIIAVSGVVLSIILTFYSTKRQLKAEIKKVHTAIEQDYLRIILAKRVEIYPKIYFELHEFMRLIFDNPPTVDELKKFDETLSELNSKYAVFLGVRTADIYYKLRRYIYSIILKMEDKGQSKVESQDRMNALRKNIQKLEIGLKKDLGIFLVEFQDGERKLKINEEWLGLKMY